MKCNHKWRGTSQGVKCLICGLELSHEEFIKSLAKNTTNDATEPQKSKKGAKK